MIQNFSTSLREDARTLSEIAEETRRIKQGRHHSVQEPPSIRLATIGEFDHPRAKLSVNLDIIFALRLDSNLNEWIYEMCCMLSKSSSTDFTKVGKNNKNRMDFVDAEEGVSGKRFLRWLGLSTSSSAGSSRQSSKKPPKRRMSTFS
uniref:Uncharacterized protein n=1 Tax=Setaria digitata TaxID=48799 RepID=A0A915Q1J5_9BILA